MHASATWRTSQPAWSCAPLFGELCSDRGLGVLSDADVSLARRSGLRVYVYLDVPERFHHGLFSHSKPKEVVQGQLCDFMRAPCTPPDPPQISTSRAPRPGARVRYATTLNEWLTSAKHCADVPLLTKLLALGALPGVHTADPAEADLFVVPFLGGFVERVSPSMTYRLNGAPKGQRLMDDLLDHLPHMNATTASRHLFLITNSCGGCNRRACTHCSEWQATQRRPYGMELAATLGPTWPSEPQYLGRRGPTAGGRPLLKQLIVPPNIMERELHDLYVPLCRKGGRPSARECRPNTARQPLFAFYQGAQSMNGFRAEVFEAVLSRAVFGPPAVSTSATGVRRRSPQPRCDCSADPSCCVNATSGVSYFHSGSHFLPSTPLGFRKTIEWMQRSRFCLCPPGDVPYNKRYFTALLAGCVPVVFSFRSQVGTERNWWKPHKGPGQRHIDPFYELLNHSRLAVEVFVPESHGSTKAMKHSIDGFLDELARVPDAVVEAKQRAIERVRHLLLFDVTGSREDAFTMMMRQLLRMLPTRVQQRRRAEKPKATTTGM